MGHGRGERARFQAKPFDEGHGRRSVGRITVHHDNLENIALRISHNSAPDQNTPQVIEFQPDGKAGKAIWTWGNQTLARQITNVYVFR